MMLETLSKIHPEDRNDSFREFCRTDNVPLTFAEDLEDEDSEAFGY